jgi:hypothetical protein
VEKRGDSRTAGPSSVHSVGTMTIMINVGDRGAKAGQLLVNKVKKDSNTANQVA